MEIEINIDESIPDNEIWITDGQEGNILKIRDLFIGKKVAKTAKRFNLDLHKELKDGIR